MKGKITWSGTEMSGKDVKETKQLSPGNNGEYGQRGNNVVGKRDQSSGASKRIGALGARGTAD
jgi:hypothetical protein